MLPKVVTAVNSDDKVSHNGPFRGSRKLGAYSTSKESAREAVIELIAGSDKY